VTEALSLQSEKKKARGLEIVTDRRISFTLKGETLRGKPMTVIELPDDQAAALSAKAAAEGLTLSAWLRKLAQPEIDSSAPRSAKEAVARILKLQKHVKPDPEGCTVKDYINYGRP
jgi:hypothetical protein